jgi:hypothetical protein
MGILVGVHLLPSWHEYLGSMPDSVGRSDRSELSCCGCSIVFIQGELHWFRGELACVQGELFLVFELWFGGLRSFLEHSFFSDVLSRCPCLRGSRLVFFK